VWLKKQKAKSKKQKAKSKKQKAKSTVQGDAILEASRPKYCLQNPPINSPALYRLSYRGIFGLLA
jgi:hypothetical protein